MAGRDIRELLGKYNITEHAERYGEAGRLSDFDVARMKKKAKKKKKGESFEAQLKREGVITKKKMSLLEKVKARRDYINRLATK